MQVSTGTTSQPSYASSPSGFGPTAGQEQQQQQLQQQQQSRRPKLKSKPKSKPYSQQSPKT
eukprot:CAMPEP_0113501602 /NCGR_PEP_ID=MMETSP0014_2-20120614/33049_1 /TAXON_ID=2857 /ORGANISM="Nitzschia sp." /LENGTH=60 /DNA_ID=CAMNT_0000396215 /DNA_START=119 /DNA_END=297 /DNA_ORIENTATION=- /assembly_acc=CAM_ASM_000159